MKYYDGIDMISTGPVPSSGGGILPRPGESNCEETWRHSYSRKNTGQTLTRTTQADKNKPVLDSQSLRHVVMVDVKAAFKNRDIATARMSSESGGVVDGGRAGGGGVSGRVSLV